jgi:EmrB/QacA subfamily drug resistance transporter
MTTTFAASPTAQRARRAKDNPWSALPVLMTGTFLVVLDFFAVNVALPSMQTRLGASNTAIEWVVAGYGLTLAALLITAARIGDRIGRRRTFTIGLASFTVASLAAGLAPNAELLVTARLLQGGAAALITPSVLAILGSAFPGPQRVRAVSVYGMVMGLAAAGGQLIGGALVQLDLFGLGWRTVFLINVPVGIAGVLLSPVLIPESRGAATRFDVAGLALISLALGALILPLIEGRAQGWPLWTWLSFAGAAVLAIAFAAQQRALHRRGGVAMFDPAVFARRSVAAGLLTQVLLWCGQASYFLVLALYLQQGRGLSPIEAGLVFSILAAAYLGGSLRAPALSIRYGRRVIVIGAALLAAGHLMVLEAVLSAGLGGSVWTLAPGLVVAGAGMGLCLAPLASVVMSTVEPSHAGAVSGALSTAQQVGNCLGVAVISVVYFGLLSPARAGGGFDHAFAVSLAILAGIVGSVSLTALLLPRRTA